MRISATRLKTFSSCGQKYHYKYIQGLDQDKTIALVLGSSVHVAIEKGYGGDNPHEIFNTEWQRLLAENNLSNDMRAWRRGVAMLERYPWGEQPEASELEFEIPGFEGALSEYTFYGFFDLIFPWGIRDLKSGARKPNRGLLNHDLQFIIYAHAYEQLFGKPPQRVEWFHLETGEALEVDCVGPAKIDYLKREIDKLLSADIVGTYDKHIGFECSWCPFREPCLGVGGME